MLLRLPLLLAVLLQADSLAADQREPSPRTQKLRLKRAAQKRAATDSDDGAADDPPPSCSCDCCETAMRRPGEISFGAYVKCSPSDVHSSDVCGSQCAPGPEDQILADEVVDMQRFCLFECKPATGAKAPEKSQCVSLTEDEASRVVDANGNALDPAFLYAGVPHHVSLAEKKRAEPASNPDSVDREHAKKMANSGLKQAEKKSKQTQKEAMKLHDFEAEKQEELHAALKETGDGFVIMDPYAAVAGLKAAAMSAKASAQQAAVFAADAIKSYGAGRKKLWKLALSQAGIEVQTWKAKAEKKARDEHNAMFAETWQMKAAKKAQEASKPYIDALLRAQESVKLYNSQGFAMAAKSRSIWAESENEAKAANKLPRGTTEQDNVAKAAIIDAREKGKEAQRLAVEARQSFQTAASVRKTIPQFQYSAQTAAAAAVAGMNGPR